MNQSPVISSPSLPPRVRDYVLSFIARQKRVALYRGVGLALVFFLSWLLVECLVDRFAHFSALIRWTMLACNFAVVAAILRRPVGNALRRRIDWGDAAARIEGRSRQFSQRLQTVTSQLLDKPEHRGSAQLLDAIMVDVDRDAAGENPAVLIPARWMVVPWLAVAGMIVIMALLALFPWLGMTHLIARAATPWRAVRPVTTTVLAVSPGNTQVLQGQSLEITANAQRLGNDPPVISVSDDGKTWRRQEMAPASQARWAFTIPAMDRDVQYYVTGGDARTDLFSARVLRKPSVAEFRIRYKYPAYTGKPNLSVTNTDGSIEAPVGSEAMISVAATEPLAGATLIAGSTRIPMSATVEPSVRETRVKIKRDQKLSLEMVSDRNVSGSGPSTMTIRAVPDLPPKIKFIQPVDDLRLTPRDVAEIQYLATDDYGVTSIGLVVQVNVSTPQEINVIPHGDPRYREGTFDLDLATLKLKIGDLVRLSLVARDGAGHVSASQDERYVLVSPRAIDANAHLRLIEAQQAESLAETLAQHLDAAGKVITDARKTAGGADTQDVEALTAARQELSSAADTAAMLRETLLRAIVHADSPDLSVALAHWVDDVQKLCITIDHAAATIDTVAQGLLPDRFAKSSQRARQLRDSLHVMVQGQLAQAILSEREDMAVAKSSPNEAQVAQLSLRTQQDIEEGAKELGLSATAADLNAQLGAKIEMASAMLKQQKAVDFVQVSQYWIKDLAAAPRRELGFDARLNTAAQAEALRPDANLIRARDLQLAGKAAGVIDGSGVNATPDMAAAATTQPSPDPKTEFVPAMAAMQKDDEMESPHAPAHTEVEMRPIRAAAEAARHKMAIWAGIVPPQGDDELAANARMLDLAMQANADTARHDYTAAARADQAMQNVENSAQSGSANANPSGQPPQAQAQSPDTGSNAISSPQARARSVQQREQGKVGQAMRSAREIDQIRQNQDQLTSDTNSADPDEAAALAQRQEAVAQAVKQVDQDEKKDDPDDPNSPDDEDKSDSRADAIAVIQAAMERLAAMPQELTTAQQSAAAWRAASAHAAAANQALAGASAQNRDAAARAAEQAHKDMDDASVRQGDAARPVSPDVSEAMSQQLSPYAPETSSATDAIDQKLTPALRELRQAIQAGDAGGVDRAAAASLAAINQVQERLRDAQNAFVQRDPLVAARLFAQEAAKDLADKKNDMKAAAGQHQRNTSQALARAWEQAAQQASAGRMMQVPALSSIFNIYSDQLDFPAAFSGAAAPAPGNLLPAVRDWATLRQRQSPDINASLQESDPPGYEASLQAYFEALNRARGQEPGK